MTSKHAHQYLYISTRTATVKGATTFSSKTVSLIFVLAVFATIIVFQTEQQIGQIEPYLEHGGSFPIPPTSTPLSSSPQNKSNDNHYCKPWEVDTDDWWTHHPDWEISTENDTHHCFSRIQNEEKAQLFRKLYHIGFSPNANCSSVITKRMISSGWGSDIIDVVDGQLLSLRTNQPLQMWVPWMWHYAALPNGTNAACPRRDMFCYFLNFTHCPPNPKQAITGRIAKKRVFHFGTPNRWLVEYTTRPQTWLRREAYQFVSTNLMLYRPDHRDVSSFNSSSKKDSRSLSRRVKAADIIRTRVRTGPFPNVSCIPMHVRRADVVLHNTHSRSYHPISSYFQALWNRTNYHHPNVPNLTDEERPFILLLTDDANAIGEALVEHGQFPWMYLDRPRHRGAEGGWENQIPSGDPRKEVIAIEAIRLLVQRCKPPLLYSESSFADHLRSMIEEQQSSSSGSATRPMHINLDWFVEDKRTLRGSNNSQTVAISKNYLAIGVGGLWKAKLGGGARNYS